MDPNEYMENEPLNETPVQESAPQEPVLQEPAFPQSPVYTEPEQPSGTYHGAGVGQKESPYASSPYYTAQQTRQADYTGPAWEPEPQKNQYYQNYQHGYQPEPPKPSKPKKQKKPMGKGLKGALAAGIALAVIAGSCGITASIVNNRWEKEIEDLQIEVQAQIVDMREQLDKTAAIGSGVSVSGSPMASEGLTPSQVYTMNVGSVVSIGNYATVSTGGFYGYFGGGGSSSEQMVSTGSGFILSEDGYVITNYHVAEGAERLTVTTHSGEEFEAQLVGYDELNDVALLKMDAAGLDAVTIGSSDDLIIGDMVVAIGNPLGELTSTQTVGYVSGKDRSVATDGSIINMLQTDAAINSGNSGGPLFNMKGEVVGITTAKYSGSTGSGASIEGIGFAIPIDDVMSMIEDLRQYGYVKNQAYLGVTVRDLDSSTAAMYSLPSGSYVDTVTEGGSAHRAGVQPKDIIIAVGEYEVSGNTELTTALRRFSAGDTTTITVYRSGQEIELPITFDEKPQSTEIPEETLPGEMPENGSYDEWYEYFSPYFGGGNG